MFILYDIIFCLYALVIFPVLFLKGKWHGGFSQRAGSFPLELSSRLQEKDNIWVHAVSVGEVAAVEGFIHQLKQAYPGKNIVLSVTTKTGYAFAQKKLMAEVILLWSPLDLSWIVGRFFQAIRPVLYIAAETELWPNLFRLLAIGQVPLVIINGRISDKAYPSYRLGRFFLKATLAKVRLFCMQSAKDTERILSLGARPTSVHDVGNIKFDLAPSRFAIDPQEFGLRKEDRIFVAGSTHPGEEKILLQSFSKLCVSFPDLRLVLVPRHPERATAVAEDVRQQGFVPVLFSKKAPISSCREVLIVDVIGQLLKLYSLADVVFVGKSLTVMGGHNIIEPATFGKPIIVGPHMQNFRDIAQIFNGAQALITVTNEEALTSAVKGLLSDHAMCQGFGQRARAIIASHQGATARTLALIHKECL